jgi:hypothetical protein
VLRRLSGVAGVVRSSPRNVIFTATRTLSRDIEVAELSRGPTVRIHLSPAESHTNSIIGWSYLWHFARSGYAGEPGGQPALCALARRRRPVHQLALALR